MVRGDAIGQSAAEPVAYRIREVNELLLEIVENAFPCIRVEGEVSNLSRPASGHVYFTLKDGADQLSVALFRGRQTGGLEGIADGRRVTVTGGLSVYGPRGTYQLIAGRVEALGRGARAEELRRLRERLAAEGLFDPARKRPLPFLPRRLGVVTSPTGAAIHDILQVLARRHPGADILVYPTRVQGEGAALQIAAAVARASREGRCDLLIVGRGGGSAEDLWCFNEEPVVRAVAASTVPVISAVGHEVDLVLADLAADRRALTPSEAAEIAFPCKADLLAEVDGLAGRLRRRMDLALAQGRERVAQAAASRLLRDPRRLFELAQQRLDELQRDLCAAVSRACGRTGAADLDGLLERLRAAAGRTLLRSREAVAHLAGRLDAASPLALSARGYHLVETADGRLLRPDVPVAAGERLRLREPRRSLRLLVEGVEPGP